MKRIAPLSLGRRDSRCMRLDCATCGHLKHETGQMMESVSVRQLKAHLSHHLKRVQSGVRLLITDRGRSIASISPVDNATGSEWAYELVASGLANWNGGKPSRPTKRLKIKTGETASSIVLEGRR